MISSGLCFLACTRRPFLDPDSHNRWTTQKGAAHGTGRLSRHRQVHYGRGSVGRDAGALNRLVPRRTNRWQCLRGMIAPNLGVVFERRSVLILGRRNSLNRCIIKRIFQYSHRIFPKDPALAVKTGVRTALPELSSAAVAPPVKISSFSRQTRSEKQLARHLLMASKCRMIDRRKDEKGEIGSRKCGAASHRPSPDPHYAWRFRCSSRHRNKRH